MQYSSNMSTEKESLSNVIDENAVKCVYYCRAGSLSLNSWDDSNEEQSDLESLPSDEQNKKNLNKNLLSPTILAEDRRKSLARVRRRTKSNGSSILENDMTVMKDNDSCESCGESVNNYSAELVAHKYRKVISPDLSPIHQNGWDSDEIISDTENYEKEKQLSPISPKISDNQSNINKCISVFNKKCTNHSEIWKDSVIYGPKINSKLSKIIEVEENRSNAGIRSNESPGKAVNSCSETKYTVYSDNISYHEVHPKSDKINFIAAEDFVDNLEYLTDEDDSDDSDFWLKIKPKIKEKNSEHVMNCEDSQYVSRSFKFIIDDKVSYNPPCVENNNGLNHVDVKRATLNPEKLKNSACSEVGESKSGEIISTGITDLPEKALHKTSSRETVEFGVINMFPAVDTVTGYHSAENFTDDCSPRRNDLTGNAPRSGRENFLIIQSSMACNTPSNRYGSRRLYGENMTELSAQEKDNLKGKDHTLYFEHQERNLVEGIFTEVEISNRRKSRSPEKIPQKMAGLNSSSSSSPLSDEIQLQNSSNKNVEVNRNSSNQSSSTSFQSEILLDLDLSDNDEKCSTTERMLFGDSRDYFNNSPTMNSEIILRSPLKNSTVSKESTMESGKSEMRQSMVFKNGKACIIPNNCDNFGNGDSNWILYETQGRKIDCPQDRGDINYENADTKACWGNLMLSLERKSPVKVKEKENVFWIDLYNERRDKCRQPENFPDPGLFVFSQGSPLRKPIKSLHDRGNWLVKGKESTILLKKTDVHFFPLKKTKYRRIKTRKRKREIAFVAENSVEGLEDETESQNRWGDRLFDKRGNWLVNSVTSRKNMLTRGKKWIQTLIMTRERGRRNWGYHRKWQSTRQSISRVSNKSTDCFSNLFKQFVNIFTVSRKSKK